MIMKKTIAIFSPQRFGLYLMKFYAEMRGLKFQFIALTAALTLVLMMSGIYELSFGTFAFMLVAYAAASASSISSMFAQRANKIKFMLTPVSQFEKFMAMILHTYVGVPVLFALSMVAAQYLSTIIMALVNSEMPQFTAPLSMVNWGDAGVVFVYFYMLTTAFYLMGATLFVRHSFVKSTGIIFVLMIIMAIVFFSYLLSLLANLQSGNLSEEYLTTLGTNIKLIASAAIIILTLFFLFITYLRITEMEVNETKR